MQYVLIYIGSSKHFHHLQTWYEEIYVIWTEEQHRVTTTEVAVILRMPWNTLSHFSLILAINLVC